MEIDSQLLFNFIPIAATIVAVTIAFIIVIQRLKWRWRVNINCWFCNVNTKIYRQELDWWQCPSCEQYNGFSKNGDYNYDIPEQRNVLLNNVAKLYSSPVKSESVSKKNGLCKTCNQNEELKLCELHTIDSTKWQDSEIETFKNNLEEKYPLCEKCNTFVKRLLRKQNQWLTQYKMLAFKQKSTRIIVNNSAKVEKVCRIFLTILSAGIIYCPIYQSMSVIGALLQLVVATSVPLSRRNFDLLLTLLWVGIGVLTPFCHSILIRPNLKIAWATLEHIKGYQIIAIISSFLGFTNLTSKNSSASSINMSFKKMNSSSENYYNSIPKMEDDISECVDEDDVSVQPTHHSPVDITHLLTTPSSNSPASTNSTIMSPNFRICDSQRNGLSSSCFIDNHQMNISGSSPKHSPIRKNISKKNALNESLRTLSTLSLSENHQKHTLKNPKIFETKMYSTTSPDLFRKNSKQIGSRKFVLAPPKLKSVSQSSWVAGGYWQTGMDTPTLSRSSSQSSGFGSAGSIFGPSREPSVVNDIDRCSTMSDATPCCHNLQRQQSTSPVNGFCSHTSSPPPCRIATPELTPTNCMVNSSANMMMTTNPCGQSISPSLCYSYHLNDLCLQNRNMNFNMIQRKPEYFPCANYSSGILTSPILLPTLLCGSLVFNIVVFCTVLLR